MKKEIKMSAINWNRKHYSEGMAYLTLFWLFDEDDAKFKQITEKEYFKKYTI